MALVDRIAQYSDMVSVRTKAKIAYDLIEEIRTYFAQAADPEYDGENLLNSEQWRTLRDSTESTEELFNMLADYASDVFEVM